MTDGETDMTPEEHNMLVAISVLLREGSRVEGNQTFTPTDGDFPGVSQPINPILNMLWKLEQRIKALTVALEGASGTFKVEGEMTLIPKE